MTIYYVATTGSNGDTGGIGDPWETITYALTQISAGDKICVRGGVYNEALTIPISGAAGSLCWLYGYPGETAEIATAGADAPIEADGKTHWVLFHLTLTSTGNVAGADGPRAVYQPYTVTDCSHWAVVDCTITGGVMLKGDYLWVEDCTLDATGASYTADNGILLTQRCSHVTIKDCAVSSAVTVDARGIHVWSDAAETDILVQGNTVSNVKEQAIDVDGAAAAASFTTVVVAGNTINTGLDAGIELENCFSCHCYGNVVDDVEFGIAAICYNALRGEETSTVIWNNLVTNADSYCLGLYNIRGVDVWFNTWEGTGASDGIDVGSDPTYVGGLDVRGNVFHDVGCVVVFYGTVTDFDTLDAQDNNVGEVSWEWAARESDWSTHTLAAYQGDGRETSSLQTDPLFVGGGDYHLQAGSPAIGVAVDLGIDDDLDGIARPHEGDYDAGAYEYDSGAPVTSTPHLIYDGVTIWTQGASPNEALGPENEANARTHIIEELGDVTTNLYRGTKRDNRGYVVTMDLLVPSGSAYTLEELKLWWEYVHSPDGGLRIVERETASGVYYLAAVPSTPQWGEYNGPAYRQVTQEYLAPTPLWYGEEASASAQFDGATPVSLACNNVGDIPTWARITIAGPVENPKIAYGSEWEIEFEISLAYGDELAIVCKTPASVWYTPFGSTAERVYGYRTFASSFRKAKLAKGSSSLTLTATFGNGLCTVSWDPLYEALP
jgi:hypothetical protein